MDEFVDIIDKPTWKSLLVEAVKKSDMDPWDLDISALTQAFLEKIEQMRKFNFRVPANAVLASAILLRFKSDSWEIYPQDQFDDKIEDLVGVEYILDGDRIPELNTQRRVTHRKVTIDELIKAVEDVIEKEKRKALRKKNQSIIPAPLLAIAFEDREDFQEVLDATYEKVIQNKDSEGICLFSDLLQSGERHEVINTLIPLLQLANSERVAIWQENHFDEIFILIGD